MLLDCALELRRQHGRCGAKGRLNPPPDFPLSEFPFRARVNGTTGSIQKEIAWLSAGMGQRIDPQSRAPFPVFELISVNPGFGFRIPPAAENRVEKIHEVFNVAGLCRM